MSIKIKRIQIQNFKLFKDLAVIDFDNPILTVFDGPNGFGKTSFYDAIELFFIGKLRRYSVLSNIIDGRTTIAGNPLVCNYSNDADDLIIKVEIEFNDITYFLMRKENCRTIRDNGDLANFTLPLYQLDDFDSTNGTQLNGESFFNDLLDIEFNKNFEFLNYIEQEENIYLLKNKDKDRKSKIAHLFNTQDFQEKIEKLNILYSKMSSGCNEQKKNEYEEIKTKIENYSTTIEVEETEYYKIFDWKEILWDQEELEFLNSEYSQWLNEDGDLFKLNNFLANFGEFQKKLNNDELDKLFTNLPILREMILYVNFLDQSDNLFNSLKVEERIKQFINNQEAGLLDAINNDKIDIYAEIKELAQSIINIDDYDSAILSLKETIKGTNTYSKLLNGIKETRNIFIEKYKEYHSQNPESQCPLCGYDWTTPDELLKKFDEQEETLSELVKSANEKLSSELDSFNQTYIKPLMEAFSIYIEKNHIDNVFIPNLKSAKEHENEIVELKKKFESFKIDLEDILNKESKYIDVEDKIEQLRTQVEIKKYDIDEEYIKTYFADYYLNYFDNDSDKVALVTLDKIEEKKKYIKWKYSLYRNSEMQRLQSEYENKKKNYDDAKELKKKIDKLKGIYKESLVSYQEKLINDIEILFHIYSGRIMQDYQNGLGLFIKSDNNEIRFVESSRANNTGEVNYNRHDAVFTMSSGQLASLIISFTLALNKRYSKSKLLFIDDPVQTLDELNIAGYVNLLRHEFSDRQIFISTHEAMMSAYMRYKFEKFGLHTQRVNFKEMYIE